MTSIVSLLADKVSDFGVRLAYGDPVTIDGATIVPVAIAYVGFGAGSGTGNGTATGKAGGKALRSPKVDADGEAGGEAGGELSGEGGGGGGVSLPIGAYVKTGDTAVFEPNVIALLAVTIPLTWVIGKAIKGIIKVSR